MADVFDNKEELKKQIATIAENEQKCVLSEPQPFGYYTIGSNSNTTHQQISYSNTIYALLFKCTGRSCILEKKDSFGATYYVLKGNGTYTPTDTTVRGNIYGLDVSNSNGVPNPPTHTDWNFTIDNFKTWTKFGTRFSNIYKDMDTATNYHLSNYNLATKQWYQEGSSSINDDFKIGYIHDYSLEWVLDYINNPDTTTKAVVSKNFAYFLFNSNTELYNKCINEGCIELSRINRDSVIYPYLPQVQKYVDIDVPLGGYHQFYNIIVTSDDEAANNYIANGTIPDDARIVDSNGKKVTLIEDDDGKESDGYKRDEWINTEENSHPTQSQLSAGTNFFYKMTTAELTAFITWFWNDVDLSDILFNAVTGLYNNMSECVLSLKYYPIKSSNSDFFRLTDKSIVLGRFATTEQYKKINSCAGNGKLCTFDIVANLEKYNLYSSKSRPHAFTDYAPYTDLYVYLPFYGYHKLDTNMCMERKIDITYSLDITTGALDYNIKISGTTVDTLSCNFGIDVPYTLSSMMELGSNVAKSVVDVALSAGTSIATNFQSSVIPAEDSEERDVPKSSKGGSNLVGNSFAPPALNINGKISNGIGLYHCLKPFLIIKHPRYYRAKNYGKIEGYPCMKAYKLNTLKGYTECERPQIQKFTSGTPTADEIGEILNILSNGIVIR